jgi:hypothetical protein
MTYTEQTHVDGALGHPAIDINRSVAVRVADDFAVMQDLPQGAQRTGNAFPVIPFFDPFSQFSFKYFANLKRIEVTFVPGRPWLLQIPQPDAGVESLVAYFSFIVPRYADDSSDGAPHWVIDPTPRTGASLYPSDVRQDAASALPSHVTLQSADMKIGMDFTTVDGYWVISRGEYTGKQSVMGLTFTVHAVTTYGNFAFPEQAPDQRLAGPPSPPSSGSAAP